MQPVDGQVVIRRDSQRQTLLIRLSPDSRGADHGFVVTFDDISELLQAQRKAAWSDVARRIAHEIKNPLTPIQLAAERLRRKYQGEIKSDPETFVSCTDTIIRQVGDIGRLVDEFSSFARMPAPTIKSEDLAALCRESTILFRSAHREIVFECAFDDVPVVISCDRHQIGQALINLLQNAIDAIEGHDGSSEGQAKGNITIGIERRSDHVVIVVTDDGKGLPEKERDRLTEPYVTTREKGTGLGLAIVRKIMEDHGGDILLEDRQGGGAIVSLIFAADLSGPDGMKAEGKKIPGRRASSNDMVKAHGA
jgi:two-component system nitrogen regulation sensor histidine kinase NtrY